MSDTARDSNVLKTFTTEGLDHLFDGSAEALITELVDPDQTLIIDQGDPAQTLINDQGHLDQTPITEFIDPDHWTLSIAAEQLKISIATVRRKLRKHQLRGYKAQGLNGPEWRIVPPDQTLIIEQSDRDQFIEGDQGDADQTPIIEQGDPDQTLINPNQIVLDVLLKRLTDVENQLANSQKQLQGAVWRNGYLESQLENEREQVKLLTDSQHKPGWWQRIKEIFYRH